MESLSHQFLTWCRSKPADEEYYFYSTRNCACAQFGKHLGLIRNGETFGSSDPLYDLHERVDDAVRSKPWTFGALADRLEAAIGEKPKPFCPDEETRSGIYEGLIGGLGR